MMNAGSQSWADSGPPTKMQKGRSGQPVPMSSGSPAKDHLVSMIKAWQKADSASMDAWKQHADQYFGGMYDPARADVADLEDFIRIYGVGEPQGSWNSHAGPDAPVDSEKAALVARVKDYQKTHPQGTAAWYEFCGATKDPS